MRYYGYYWTPDNNILDGQTIGKLGFTVLEGCNFVKNSTRPDIYNENQKLQLIVTIITTLCSPHFTKVEKLHLSLGPFRPLRPKQFNNTFNDYYVIFKPDKTQHIHNLLNPTRPEPDYSEPDRSDPTGRVGFESGVAGL